MDTTSNDNVIEKLSKKYRIDSAPETKKEVLNDLQMLFDVAPRLSGIHYRSFTPGFCDGDPCYNHFLITAVLSDGVLSNGDLYDIYVNDGLREFVKLSWEEQKVQVSDCYIDGSYEEIVSWIISNFLPLRLADIQSRYSDRVFEGPTFDSPEFDSKDPLSNKLYKIISGMEYKIRDAFYDDFDLFITRDETGKIFLEQRDYNCGY